MRILTVVSGCICLVALAICAWLSHIDLSNFERWSLLISTWAATGALVSAAFVIHGYLISLKAFVESQKPRILLHVENGTDQLLGTETIAHITRIVYENRGSVECDNLVLSAMLICGNETYRLENLFNSPYLLQVGDVRCRGFPTTTALPLFGVPAEIVDNLSQCVFRVGYQVKSLDGQLRRSFDYRWNSELSQWGIA